MTVLAPVSPKNPDRSPHAIGAPLGAPWPASARRVEGDILVGGVSLADLAARHGTAVYVLDESEVRTRALAYRCALPNATVLYAAKAFLCGAMVRWMDDDGLGLDVCSGNELGLALAQGFPARRIVMHGNAKSEAELDLAVRSGVGRIVVDSFSEIAHLAALAPADEPQGVYVRVVPGVAAGHHAAVRTGVDDQQFGFPLSGGFAAEAASRVLNQPHLRLEGLHCHLGSQISQVEPFLIAVDRMVELLSTLRDRYGIILPELDLGGGHAIAYRPGEPALDPARYAAAVLPRLAARCAEHNLPVPRLVVEPGRAIVGPAGVALYRVLAVKHSPSGHRFVAVDGGMSDNPRPALYGAGYTAQLVGRFSREPLQGARVVGRHCEAGDVLVPDALLPEDTRPGDLLAIPAAGAYQLSMSSGYNMVGRPPLVAVRDGAERLLLRRETLEDILRREIA
ncbi:MAG TPA: diaminopimelate decarboxylase [Actinocrinis sp.]|uniref:diaminopimelate decarboxylase n=1 Tax=Actinocrinis sp. TaxID=1920516 RepID=UPI002DDDBB1C|nr:diaminopimelate decarboxylase [Actinocrinis sp.]HEV3171509.1 diaminopimelate decarboxylase [Actinocrinis sp.]